VLTNRRFVDGLDINRLEFDPEAIGESYRSCASAAGEYPWKLDPHVLRRLIARPTVEAIEDEEELFAGVGV